MFGIDRLTKKVKGVMKAFLNGERMDSNNSIVIETYLEHDLKDRLDHAMPCEEDCHGLQVIDELQNYMKVKDEIEAAIKESCHRDHNCPIILPKTLTARVSEDIVRMSLSEPCGIHGCVIFITIQDKGKAFPLATVYGNMSAPPTFEIHLTLLEDNCGWNKLHKAFLVVKSCILNSRWKVAPKILRSSYQLEKRKLYRSASSSVENVPKSVNV